MNKIVFEWKLQFVENDVTHC